ncbi:MAG: sulfatase-like hydrolase/transferase [Lachnospiraceae bacterium]|nr:sulfatase-like hydrolase/transferase [Lachnospiraceae bacterium]
MKKIFNEKTISFLNKYSLAFHALLACTIVFFVEVISRRDFLSACSFVGTHTLAFLYNAFIVFASLTLVYLFRRRTFWRIIITGFWTILGVINGCILSNRVTPFGYTDLKCISDLLSMTDTSYFTAQQATLAVFGIGIFLALCVILFIKGPKFQGRIRKLAVPASILAVLFIVLPLITSAVQSTHVVASYFSNIAKGYEDYGFIYGFSSSVVDRGMEKPSRYSESTIEEIQKDVNDNADATTVAEGAGPNIICVLLESVCDPEEIKFLETSGDPLEYFHYLEDNFSTGYLTVPVVGAGTANSEFEVLSGMSMQYFGTGEYPYKTILKKTDCEAIAADLASIGYGTHAVHNNGGNFYSRVNAFSMMGFDSFTSKEMMNITEYTPAGSWPTDDILVDETIKTLDATPNQPDFTYTITVSTHGDYPTEPVIENPEITVSGDFEEDQKNAWTYYVHQLNEIDRFMEDLCTELDKREEDTIVVFFGDHLPTMGLEDEDMVSGDIYKTKYVTWNNMGLEKKDADLYAYQLMAKITEDVGISEGTIFRYHQANDFSVDADYLERLENLQYDILYGERYVYGGEDKYPATEIVMGIDDVVLNTVRDSYDGNRVLFYGKNFTKWSKVYVNGEKVPTSYQNGNMISIKKDYVKDGDTVVVCQVGSSSTIFRSSNEMIYEDVNVGTTETLSTQEETTETQTETESQSSETSEETVLKAAPQEQ